MTPKDEGEYISAQINLKVPVCVVIKKRLKNGRWQYQECVSFRGDWNDLVYELYSSYGQFTDVLDYCPSSKAVHERLDKIADVLASKDRPYEFFLPDFTDDEYVAYCKEITYYLDNGGELS